MSLIFYNLLRKHLSTKMIFDNIFKPAKKDQSIEQDGRLKVVLNNQKKGTICTRIKNAIQIISTIVSSSEKLIMLKKYRPNLGKIYIKYLFAKDQNFCFNINDDEIFGDVFHFGSRIFYLFIPEKLNRMN